jgi:hypothetical protein
MAAHSTPERARGISVMSLVLDPYLVIGFGSLPVWPVLWLGVIADWAGGRGDVG